MNSIFDPIIIIENKNKQAFGTFDGLTKREYIATMAMQGLLHNFNENGMYGNHIDYPMVHKQAVYCADELLKQLSE